MIVDERQMDGCSAVHCTSPDSYAYTCSHNMHKLYYVAAALLLSHILLLTLRPLLRVSMTRMSFVHPKGEKPETTVSRLEL